MSDELAYLMPEELDKLQTTLVEHMQESGCMPLDVAHGFLTAVAAHQQLLSPEAARAEVLGQIAGEQGIDPLLSKFQAQLLRDLQNNEYGPLIMQMPRDDGSMLPIPYGWCEGYVHGLAALGDEQQTKAQDSDEAAKQLSPIFGLLMYEESQLFDPPNEQQHREAVSLLGESAVWMYRWWQAEQDGGVQ